MLYHHQKLTLATTQKQLGRECNLTFSRYKEKLILDFRINSLFSKVKIGRNFRKLWCGFGISQLPNLFCQFYQWKIYKVKSFQTLYLDSYFRANCQCYQSKIQQSQKHPSHFIKLLLTNCPSMFTLSYLIKIKLVYSAYHTVCRKLVIRNEGQSVFSPTFNWLWMLSLQVPNAAVFSLSAAHGSTFSPPHIILSEYHNKISDPSHIFFIENSSIYQ